MSVSEDLRQQITAKLNLSMGKLSSSFMEVSDELKSNDSNNHILKKFENLFKILMMTSQELSTEMNNLLEKYTDLQKANNQLSEEKRRMEVLYSSGILFSSETEMRTLMETAIETIVKELKADAGFIVLTNEFGQVNSVFAQNMDPDSNPDALEMSNTVITNTIKSIQPLQVDDTKSDGELSKKSSILKLGISAVLCIPLVHHKRVFGAAYLDRRNRENPFIHQDLTFFISFARQVVRGLEISMEISSLEKQLLTESINRFEDLRKEFKCESIIGSSKKLFDVLKLAAKIAPTDASVLILGENGTGKDLIARAIHQNSKRKDKSFVTIDCGSIPPDLLESELFGYESGAFTGATKSKPGKLEAAEGGTLFFDEIGEMNINLQAKLLRVLQTREIERLGSVQTKKIDVRVISATNRNLADLVSKGLFREDLYYRLKVIEIVIPNLRDRKEDIIDLVEKFLEKHAQGDRKLSISEAALEVLEAYSWPGNVRELENVILRCAVLAKNSLIDVSDLPQEIIDKKSDEPTIKLGKTLTDAETEFRRMYILKTLRQTSSKTEAAQLLGINRTHFYKLLSQLSIDL